MLRREGGSLEKVHKIIKYSIYTVLMMLIFFHVSLEIYEHLESNVLIPALLTLAVFLVAIATEGYIYGIVASIVSVILLNYAFTFPYFRFNFSMRENFISAIIMLVITIISSTLITKVKLQEKIKAETEKERMRANLLRAVSHDLRTPLTTIYGSSQAIADEIDNLTNEQISKLADGIKEDAQWLVSMVENLLMITRIDNNGVKLKKTPVVLWELIDSVLIKFRKRYPNQEVGVDIPEDFISIPMDAMLIEQVIMNLLENAVIHAKGMDLLEIKVFVEGKNAIFEILDNGSGIAKDKMENIFTGFFERENTHVDNKKHSMGIGLSVCASIIRAHEGSITVRNRKNGGSCFGFSLTMEGAKYE